MTRLAPLLIALFLSACGQDLAPETQRPDRPVRVVSLDYCADQYVLKLLDRDHILALSPDAGREFSYMRNAADGLPTVRPSAEDVIILKPDLVVRTYGGGPNASAFFRKAGIPVVDVGWTPDIPSVMANTQRIADELGESERGAAVNAEMQKRLDELRRRTARDVRIDTDPGLALEAPHAQLVSR